MPSRKRPPPDELRALCNILPLAKHIRAQTGRGKEWPNDTFRQLKVALDERIALMRAVDPQAMFEYEILVHMAVLYLETHPSEDYFSDLGQRVLSETNDFHNRAMYADFDDKLKQRITASVMRTRVFLKRPD